MVGFHLQYFKYLISPSLFMWYAKNFLFYYHHSFLPPTCLFPVFHIIVLSLEYKNLHNNIYRLCVSESTARFFKNDTYLKAHLRPDIWPILFELFMRRKTCFRKYTCHPTFCAFSTMQICYEYLSHFGKVNT